MLTMTPTQDSSPKPTEFIPKLPYELWNHIFVFATSSESRILHGVEYRFVTKRSLVLVCKLWHAIALPLLYDLVCVRDASIARLFLRTLVDTATTDEDTPAGYGKWVHCLILPRGTALQNWDGIPVTKLLDRCPNITDLLKLSNVNSDFWDGIAYTASGLRSPAFRSFTSLKTILWCCSSERTQIFDAPRLTAILRCAPNLILLYILNVSESAFQIQLPSNEPMRRLTRIIYMTGLPSARLCLRQADMPNLSFIKTGLGSLIHYDPIDGNEDRSSLLALFGSQLRAIDLTNSIPVIRGAIVHDVRSILRRCPNLHTFTFDVCPTVLSPDSGILHPSLRVIVLRITATQEIGDEEREQSLRAHIKTIMGDAFPALHRVELHVMEGAPGRFYQACRDLLERFPLERVKGTVTVWSSSAS